MRLLPLVCITATIVLAFTSVHGADRKAIGQKPEQAIRTAFDNASAQEDLRRSWGFSAIVEFRWRRFLFDAGSDPVPLLEHLDLKVRTVMPAHCSDHAAKEMFQTLYGRQFHRAGAGCLTVLDQGKHVVSTLPRSSDQSSE